MIVYEIHIQKQGQVNWVFFNEHTDKIQAKAEFNRMEKLGLNVALVVKTV